MVAVARGAGAIAAQGAAPLPTEVLVLALSGVKSRADVLAYERDGGVRGILVGEALMRAPDPAALIHSLVSADGDHGSCLGRGALRAGRARWLALGVAVAFNERQS